MLNYFTSSHKISRKQFVKAVEDDCGMTLSEQDTKLLLKVSRKKVHVYLFPFFMFFRRLNLLSRSYPICVFSHSIHNLLTNVELFLFASYLSRFS